ncbi:MAG TPA: FAD-dependent oxidoreductase [bacterium]|nr:FAD-dependent oxidoreductase [bacterium]
MLKVVVAGAGIIGATCAYYAARAGHRVTVFDPGEIGAATTAVSGSSVLAQTKTSPLLLDLTRRSQALYEELKRDLGVPYQVEGSLILFRTANEEAFVRDRCVWLRAQGVRVDMLSGAEVRTQVPSVAARVRGAAYAPLDAEVAPREAAVAIAHGAAQLGAVFSTGIPVTDLDVAGGSIRGVVTPAGSTACDEVVLAAGPWTGRIAAPHGIAVPIRPQKGELLFTGPAQVPLRGRVLAATYLMSKFGTQSPDGFSAGLVVGREPDGSIKIGSTRECAQFDTTPTARAREILLREAREYVPDVAALPIRRQTAGLRPYSLLKRPIIGRVPGVGGLILACGHGGDGIALAPITGWLVAQFIEGAATGLEGELALAEPTEGSAG